jgi:hypothetical protein
MDLLLKFRGQYADKFVRADFFADLYRKHFNTQGLYEVYKTHVRGGVIISDHVFGEGVEEILRDFIGPYTEDQGFNVFLDLAGVACDAEKEVWSARAWVSGSGGYPECDL